MRKLLFLIVFGISMFALNNSVEAGWINVGYCSGAYTPINKSNIKHPNNGSIDLSFGLAQTNKICTNNSNLEIIIIENSGEIKYCSAGSKVPKDLSGKYFQNFCCPANNIAVGLGCCPAGTVNTNNTQTQCIDGSNNRTDVGPSIQRATITPDNTSITFRIGEDVKTCDATGCLVLSGGLLANSNTTINNPLSQTEITTSGIDCLDAKAPLTGYRYEGGAQIPADYVCLAQKAVPAESADVIDLNNAIAGCADLSNQSEIQRCLDCFARNIDPNDPDKPQTFVYSSIGCIDTSRDAFIVRLFQLGFGILSGFAVVRIMMGAIKRQSTDPAKIQEGRDMIWSAITALVMLGAAIPILRYIGINLLGVLPTTFLG